MGTAALAIVALVAWATPAHAECTKIATDGSRYPICFDPGNRISLVGGSDGVGGSIAVRHVVHFEDDPDLSWKLEHVVLDVRSSFVDGEGAVYRGRFVRHTRDGHIVLPSSPPKKIFLPFDIGAAVEAGAVRVVPDDPVVHIGIVKTAALVDLWRSRDFRRRLAIGPQARWGIDIGRDHLESPAIARHAVAPFSTGIANLHVESANGLTVGDVSIEAGSEWTSDAGWVPTVRAEGTLERTLLAINDHPISVLVGVRYADQTATARIAARVALFR